ncbi:unnamed protein product [Ambrosiozyma monospora]|uniref:Unnamed protein product n=1 Tax=Ambrosiozyma monospora TaxID=43982 RepID=A0ACB5U142_AMBMO|nr:unnamed protein product [Ambrosiozyma monospora]
MSTSIFEELTKHTKQTIDTMEEEDSQYFKNVYGVEFLNATSNQGIVFNNWVKHPAVLVQAADLVKTKFAKEGKTVPTSSTDATFDEFIDEMFFYGIAITGKNQLKNIHGKVLSQVRTTLIYDTDGIVDYGKRIIAAYEEVGVDRTKVIVKIPVTWEAMQAVPILKKENISCLGTVVQTLEQAVIAAEAGCVAISPYVDEFKYNLDPASYVKEDLSKNYGYVETVKIHKYYKAYGIKCNICIASMIGINTMLYMSGIDEMTTPILTIHKCLTTPVPKDFKFPYLKHEYTAAEAGPKLAFFNEKKEHYYDTLNKNTVGTDRINFACKFFEDMHGKSALLMKNTLLEHDYIKN